MLQHLIEKQESLMKAMKEEPAIGKDLLDKNVFYK